ncbi:MAG TPA: DUF5069 domain-containing protein [Candidatus Dormibacteraeota bacterium]|nr:DUF5069 domain-containing protein [Candidatus Dormibacteraeota bacterium]
MATAVLDLQTAFPRSGRERIGAYAWLGRMADKARASVAGTIGEYIYPCPMDKGFLERLGVTPEQFTSWVEQGKDDAALAAALDERTTPERRDAANRWVLVEKAESLARQDAEEGRSPS